jgi:hypothetical protein
VKAPWDTPDVKYPPPLPALLEMHYQTSIAKAMEANGGDYELYDDDYDDEELSEPEEVRNEAVRIWIDSTLSNTEITAPLDITAGDKGNIDTA